MLDAGMEMKCANCYWFNGEKMTGISSVMTENVMYMKMGIVSDGNKKTFLEKLKENKCLY